MITINVRRLLIYLSLIVLLTGCVGAWEVTLTSPTGEGSTVTRADYKALEAFTDDDGSLPVERVLYEQGYRVIETLHAAGSDGATQIWTWPDVAEEARWFKDGTLQIGGATIDADRITLEPPALAADITASLQDIAPTAAAALDIPAPSKATGHVLAHRGTDDVEANQVLLLFLDGFGYVRYREALEAGLIPHLAALEEPVVGHTEYPPCTVVGSATILTGAPPSVNGAVDRRTRSTEIETLFDVVKYAGLEGIAVEGNALSFNLRNAEITLSGDRDNNGSTDDNVLTNALDVLDQGMPDLFWVHFHGIDDAGHTYGPGAPEEMDAVAGVDAAVGEILSKLPPRTLVLIFADHGMHAVQEGDRLGNHNNLIARDMLVPIWVLMTP